MDWIKKNMVLVVSSLVALIAVGASGYYLWVQMAKYEAAGGRLSTADSTLSGLENKKPHPGDDKVDNIAAVKKDIDRLNGFKDELTATFKSIPVTVTSEQDFKSELAETLAYLEREGKRVGVTAPTNFNLSFTAQKVGFRFASNSVPPLSVQLADLKEITKLLVDARVNSIESFRRVPVSDDDKGENSVEDEYLTNFKITTNEFTGAVVHPYEVTFRCFSEEFGKLLEGIAHSPYSIILKTVEVEPGKVRNVKSFYNMSAEELYSSMGMTAAPGAAYGGMRPTRAGEGGGVNTRGGGGQMTSRYGGGGGGRDTQANSRYGGGGPGGSRAAGRYGAGAGGRQEQAVPAYNPGGGSSYAPPVAVAPTPTGPEVILTEEPIKVTVMLNVVRMPEEAEAKPAAN